MCIRDSVTYGTKLYEQLVAFTASLEGVGQSLDAARDKYNDCLLYTSVCNVSVDILTSEDHYVPSELWRRKEVHVESDAEMLAVGVPKAVTLYKSKVIERMSRELREKLQDENLTDDEMQDIMQRLSNLNRGKVSIARKLHRLIL